MSKISFNSFGEFIDKLFKVNELIEVNEEIATELEITQFADCEMKSDAGGKALLFKKPTINGKESSFHLAINSFGSWDRVAMSLSRNNISELRNEIESLIKIQPPKSFKDAIGLLKIALNMRHLRPRNVTSSKAQDNCYIFEEDPLNNYKEGMSMDKVWGKNNENKISLSDLPVLKCWPNDGGRFITLPCVHTYDPITKVRNVGMYRMQIYSELEAGIHWQTQKVGKRHSKFYKDQKLPMPVAITLGGNPAYTFSATAPLPDGVDELQLAAFIKKSRVDLVDCKTIPMKVPADVDFVIEGVIFPSSLKPEGPFGDHTGYYTEVDDYPYVMVSAITHKNNAIYPATIVGKPPMEDFYIGTAGLKIMMPILQSVFPEIVDIALPYEGVFHNFLFVSIKKQYPYHAYKIMNGLWGMGQMMFSKYIIVLDEDCDVNDTSEVLFRIGANTDPARDCNFSKSPCDSLDHATNYKDIGSHLGIDATKKMKEEGYTREWPDLIKMDQEIKDKIHSIRKKYLL